MLINAFEVASGDDARVTRMREATRGDLRAQPGDIETALHQAVSPDADIRFVNVARWGSPHQLQAAAEREGFRAVPSICVVSIAPGPYRIVGE